MSRSTLTRLCKLEAQTFQRGAMVHVIPAHTDQEYAEMRAAFIQEHGINPSDIFVQIQRFTEE